MTRSNFSGWQTHLPPGSRYDATASGAGTPVQVWRRHMEQRPDRACLLDGMGRSLTWGELDVTSRRVAGRLRAAGVTPHDRVLFSMANSLEGVAAHVACLRLGAVALPTNTAYRADELKHVIRDARPTAAWVDSDERQQWIQNTDPGIRVLVPDNEQHAEAPPVELDRAAPDDPALIGYTSGTTGRPKGAVLSHANMLASVEALRLAWRWSPEDRLLLCLPLFHMHGLGVGIHGTLHAGACAIVLPRFDPDAVLTAMQNHTATLFFGVPTLYHRFLDHPGVGQLRHLRLCVSGSAALAAELHQRFERATGHRILERYGMTETAMLISNPVQAERRAGTVGLPLPGVEFRLSGDPAEIQVRGPNVFSGYWERPDADAEAFTEDGFFRTGDLGHLDAEGYVCIRGRAKELIISGGYNVYPREVEEALRQHPEIEDAAVVGSESAEWGEIVSAYLVAPKTISETRVRDFLEDRLAAYKHPRIVYHLDSLPRNALGKVQKHRLAHGQIVPESDS